MMNLIRHLLVLSILAIIPLISCNKAIQEVTITYSITDSDSGFDVRYRNDEGNVVFEKVSTDSESDVWKYTFEADPGEILFISANYYDVNSKIKVRIMLDGKIFREASSRYDTSNFVVVSGTVPY
ncbi:MAG TPA: hypothetical protein PKI34_08545 [Bacteroidales bacterium]|nr:hypothetical protein [Bacteroidales bacterium]